MQTNQHYFTAFRNKKKPFYQYWFVCTISCRQHWPWHPEVQNITTIRMIGEPYATSIAPKYIPGRSCACYQVSIIFDSICYVVTNRCRAMNKIENWILKPKKLHTAWIIGLQSGDWWKPAGIQSEVYTSAGKRSPTSHLFASLININAFPRCRHRVCAVVRRWLVCFAGVFNGEAIRPTCVNAAIYDSQFERFCRFFAVFWCNTNDENIR